MKILLFKSEDDTAASSDDKRGYFMKTSNSCQKFIDGSLTMTKV